jgi:hypothetical protein
MVVLLVTWCKGGAQRFLAAAAAALYIVADCHGNAPPVRA